MPRGAKLKEFYVFTPAKRSLEHLSVERSTTVVCACLRENVAQPSAASQPARSGTPGLHWDCTHRRSSNAEGVSFYGTATAASSPVERSPLPAPPGAPSPKGSGTNQQVERTTVNQLERLLRNVCCLRYKPRQLQYLSPEIAERSVSAIQRNCAFWCHRLLSKCGQYASYTSAFRAICVRYWTNFRHSLGLSFTQHSKGVSVPDRMFRWSGHRAPYIEI